MQDQEEDDYQESDEEDGSDSFRENRDFVATCDKCRKYLYHEDAELDVEFERVVLTGCCNLCLGCAVNVGGYSSVRDLPRGWVTREQFPHCLCRRRPKPTPTLTKFCVRAIARELRQRLSFLPDSLGTKIAQRLGKKEPL